MSRNSWRAWLKKKKQKLSAPAPARIALLGVGNELNGDDGAGVLVARAMAAGLRPAEGLFCVEGGSAPENFSGPLCRFSPDLLLIVDAGRLDLPPGRIAWLELDELEAAGAFSHGLPLSVLAEYVRGQTGCQVGVLAIQVEQTGFDMGLSAPVAKAVQRLVQSLPGLLRA